MKNEKAICLVEQMIEKSIIEDRRKEYKKIEETAGESWMTFHLKSLKELLLKE